MIKRTNIISLISAGALLALSSGAVAQIAGSKHDMTQAGTSQVESTATTEVCVFCHTPHGADTDASVPLWNRELDTTRVYQRYSALGTSTLDGAEAPVGSTSLACLSCHDGQQAMDSVINAPGSGGYNVTGGVIGGGGGVQMTGTPIPNLGLDLRDDHPISIQYAGGACQGAPGECDPSVAATGDPDFEVAKHTSVNGNDQWYVDTTGVGFTGTPDVREKTDMILYTRNDFTGGGGGTGPSVECGSCHDPHNANTESVVVGQESVAFLRITNTGSQVCLACHIK